MIGFALALEHLLSLPNQENTSLYVMTLLVSAMSLRCASPPLSAKVRERLHVTLTARSPFHGTKC